MLADGKEKSSNKEFIFFWFSVYEMCPPILVCEPCTTNLIAAQLSTSPFYKWELPKVSQGVSGKYQDQNQPGFSTPTPFLHTRLRSNLITGINLFLKCIHQFSHWEERREHKIRKDL